VHNNVEKGRYPNYNRGSGELQRGCLVLSNDTPEMSILRTAMDPTAFDIMFERICDYKIATGISTEWDIEKQYRVLEL
jgi:hypothetical protein